MLTIRVKPAPAYDFTSNVCGETAGSLHYISGITPERAKQVLNIDKGGGNPPLTYFIECIVMKLHNCNEVIH